MYPQEPLLVRVSLTPRRLILLVPTLAVGLPALLFIPLLPLIAPSQPVEAVKRAFPLVLALVPFGMAGVAMLGRVLLRTPVIELDRDGVRIRGPWPSPPHWDLTLAWDDVERVQATSHHLYPRGWFRFDSLWFVPKADVAVQLGWRDRFLTVLDLSRAPRLRGYRVGISAGWNYSVHEVVTYAQRACADLPFTDDRQDSPFGHYARRPSNPPSPHDSKR